MQDKVKNWEELCNDGENYGDKGENLSPKEKILFEKIKQLTQISHIRVFVRGIEK